MKSMRPLLLSLSAVLLVCGLSAGAAEAAKPAKKQREKGNYSKAAPIVTEEYTGSGIQSQLDNVEKILDELAAAEAKSADNKAAEKKAERLREKRDKAAEDLMKAVATSTKKNTSRITKLGDDLIRLEDQAEKAKDDKRREKIEQDINQVKRELRDCEAIEEAYEIFVDYAKGRLATGSPFALAEMAAPPFAGKTYGQEGTTNSKDANGKAIVLVFFSGVNKNSVAGLKEIESLGSAFKPEQAMIVGIAVDEKVEDLDSLLHGKLAKIPVIHDSDNAISSSYCVRLLPQTVVVNPQGTVAKVVIGKPNKSKLRDLIDELLVEKK